MRKYVTPPFWILIGSLVVLGANLAALVNGWYPETTVRVITRVVAFGALGTVGYLYRRNPAWDPLVIKAKAEKAKIQAKRRAKSQERRERTEEAATSQAKENPGPRKPSGW